MHRFYELVQKHIQYSCLSLSSLHLSSCMIPSILHLIIFGLDWCSQVRDNTDELARLITLEHGKNHFEALGDVNKGNETVEYACGMASLAQGNVLEVSRGIICQDKLVNYLYVISNSS